MSDLSTPGETDHFILDPDERRVIGVLIEKSLTTPSAYPLTVTALVTGSNQKSNRDPQVEFVDEEVEEILARLQRRGLVTEHYSAGGRMARWRQEFTGEVGLTGQRMAVVGELLLRGAQTLGELRTRASRMKQIPDLAALDAIVKDLESMDPPRMVRLSPAGRQRGVRYTHGFQPVEELDALREAELSGAPAAAPARAPRGPSPEAVEGLEQRVAALEERIARLESQLG